MRKLCGYRRILHKLANIFSKSVKKAGIFLHCFTPFIKKKIIATDINGNRGILAKYNGTLVENSISGLENGIIEFLDGKVETPLFDVDSYQDSAIRMFIENID